MDEVINVQIIDMDLMIPEQVTKNADGSYTIFLNARLTQERRLQSYNHAMFHIKSGDFDNQMGAVQEIEQIAHAVSKPLSEEPPISTNSIDEKRVARLTAMRKEHKKIQKQLQKYERDMAILELHGVGLDTFARGEHFKLYGNDL